MAITDESRFHLHQRLEAVLGHEEASTLMEHLPSVGWADVATKRDLDHLEHSIRQDLALGLTELRGELTAGLATGRADMQASMNRLLLQLIGVMLAFVTVVIIAGRIG